MLGWSLSTCEAQPGPSAPRSLRGPQSPQNQAGAPPRVSSVVRFTSVLQQHRNAGAGAGQLTSPQGQSCVFPRVTLGSPPVQGPPASAQ